MEVVISGLWNNLREITRTMNSKNQLLRCNNNMENSNAEVILLPLWTTVHIYFAVLNFPFCRPNMRNHLESGCERYEAF